MARTPDRLRKTIRKALAASGAPASAFCARAGIEPALMSRFLAGKSALGLANLEAMADLLGLALVQVRKPKVKPGFAKPGRKPKAKRPRPGRRAGRGRRGPSRKRNPK